MTSATRLARLLPLTLIAGLAAACGGSSDDSSASACPEGACSGHGTCSMLDGSPSCTCDPGFGGPNCVPDCSTLSCGDHGTCSLGEAGAVCACDEGYAGDACDVCADGHQDHDGDGACAADCSTAGLDCRHADCDDSSGEAVCVCWEGHTGDDCEGCVPGYQDHDGDGTCRPTCETAYPYCGHGKCDDAGGEPVCVCSPTWGGDHCDECAEGYQDHDGDGACLPGCEAAALSCVHGQCDDSEGEAQCACEQAYGGEDCSACANGYQDHDGDGFCQPACGKAGLDCGYGFCTDLSGEAVCVCETGYEGAACDQCAFDFQDHDGDGTCWPACSTPGYDCSGMGTCSDATGYAVCACTSGLYDDGAGKCVDAAGFWCSSAVDLDVFGGGVTGTTLGAGDEHDGGCQPNTGEEMVYTFTLAEPRRLRFHATGFDTVLYVRSVCDDKASEVVCNDDGAYDSTAWLEHDFAPGQYFLFVDGYGTSGGDYAVDIDVLCGPGELYDASSGTCVDDPCDPNPCAGPHASCDVDLPGGPTCTCEPGWVDGAQAGSCEPDPTYEGEACADPLTLEPGVGSVTGSTLGAADDAVGSCGGSGPDRVHVVTVTERMRATFATSGYDTVLYLRSKCEKSGSQLGCNDDASGVGSELTAILEPGTYFLFVDSADDVGGDYELSYEFRPDPCGGDPCPGLPACVASSDWASHACVCPSGTLPYGADCVDDPCDPNPCAGAPGHRTRCEPDLPNAQHECVCSVGYLEDAGGSCVPDPDAADWSFIVFINADNNLEDDGYDDLAEMGVAGSTASVHIAALFDTYTKDNGDARKVTVNQGGYVVEENLGEVDMGDWNTLAEYGVWAVNRYPARHYALVLWNHGDGWRHRLPDTPPLFKGFSTDDHGNGEGISISNGDYAKALAAISDELGDKLDLVGFDACLMGMWEVAEATAPFAHVLVASEETEPLSGWPYDDFMVPLVQAPETGAVELGTWIVDAYHADRSDNSTLSVVDLDTMAQLRTSLSAFADALRAQPALYSTWESRRKSTQSFSWFDEYRDLKDFARRVRDTSTAPPEVVSAATALVDQLDVTIVHAKAQTSHPRATGLSIYFPARGGGMDDAYRGAGAVWSVNTSWDEFLESFTQ